MAVLSDKGAHCTECGRLDYLPFRCDACGANFCLEHFRPGVGHACGASHSLEKLAEGAARSKTHVARCPVLGCREALTSSGSLQCHRCGQRVCLKHRYEDAHPCTPMPKASSLRGFTSPLVSRATTSLAGRCSGYPAKPNASSRTPPPPTRAMRESRGTTKRAAPTIAAAKAQRIPAKKNTPQTARSSERSLRPSGEQVVRASAIGTEKQTAAPQIAAAKAQQSSAKKLITQTTLSSESRLPRPVGELVVHANACSAEKQTETPQIDAAKARQSLTKKRTFQATSSSEQTLQEAFSKKGMNATAVSAEKQDAAGNAASSFKRRWRNLPAGKCSSHNESSVSHTCIDLDD